MMEWTDIVDRQTKEYGDHIKSIKTSREQLQADKQAVIAAANTSEAELPDNLKSMLQRNTEAWEKEYGMYGSRFKEMRVDHQKELNQFFARDAKQKEITKDVAATKDKSKEKSQGR